MAACYNEKIRNEKTRSSLQFFFDKGEITSQAAENMHIVYGPKTVRANHA